MGRDEPDDRRGRDRESRPDGGSGRRDGSGAGGSSSSRYGEPPSRGGGDRHMAEADRSDRGRSNGGGGGGGGSSRGDVGRPREREVAATDRQARGDRDSDKPRDKERDRKRDKEREERNAQKEAIREKEKARWAHLEAATARHTLFQYVIL